MIIANGRVVEDLTVSVTSTGTQYIAFSVAEDIGFGEKATTVFHRCTIWGEEMVTRIVNAKVKKGSPVQIIGEQTISAFIRNNGEAAAQSNVRILSWSYLPIGSKKMVMLVNLQRSSREKPDYLCNLCRCPTAKLKDHRDKKQLLENDVFAYQMSRLRPQWHYWLLYRKEKLCYNI